MHCNIVDFGTKPTSLIELPGSGWYPPAMLEPVGDSSDLEPMTPGNDAGELSLLSALC